MNRAMGAQGSNWRSRDWGVEKRGMMSTQPHPVSTLPSFCTRFTLALMRSVQRVRRRLGPRSSMLCSTMPASLKRSFPISVRAPSMSTFFWYESTPAPCTGRPKEREREAGGQWGLGVGWMGSAPHRYRQRSHASDKPNDASTGRTLEAGQRVDELHVGGVALPLHGREEGGVLPPQRFLHLGQGVVRIESIDGWGCKH